MRIWCQSCAAIGNDATMREYEQLLEARAQQVARPGTVVEFHGVDAPIPATGQAYAASYICTEQCIRNAIRAKREGYDVFASICTMDNGYSEIKQLVDLPVVFSMEVALHLALLLAPSFGFLAQSQSLLLRLVELAKRYGLANQMVQGGCLKLNFKDFQNLFWKPEAHTESIVERGQEIVARGASILVPSGMPLNMFLVQQGIREIDGAPILDVFAGTIKMAELAVELKASGIVRSKHGLFAAPPHEAVAALERLFGAD